MTHRKRKAGSPQKLVQQKSAPKTLLDYQGAVKSDKKLKDWEDAREKAREYVSEKVMGKK